MSQYKYSFKTQENMARAVGRSLSISTKHSVEICSRIRNKPIEEAKRILNQAIEMKIPIRFTRFNRDRGHKKGMGAGRFPVKACKEILKIINAAEANAQFKGLGGELKLVHVSAQKAGKQFRYGRKRRRIMKRSNIEVVVQEVVKRDVKKVKKPVMKKAGIKKADKAVEGKLEK